VYKVPDVCPSEMITEEHDFSMAAGEFCEVYKEQPEMVSFFSLVRLGSDVFFHRHC
jgi:hypothetical protein